MSYLERRLKASFRGVPFIVRTAESEFTKVVATEKFINASRLYTEDLGKSHDLESVEGFLVGPDHDLAVKNLRDAVLENGPGILIHPIFGQRSVVAKSMRVVDAIEEIGMVKVFLSFIEAGEEIFPREALLPGSAITAAESSARAAFKDAFLKAFRLANLAPDGIARVRQSIKGIVETAKSLTALSQQGFKESADLAVGLGSLNADIETVIRTPAKVAEILENSARVVRASGQPILGKLSLLSRLQGRSRKSMAAEAGQAESVQPIIAVQKFFSALCLLETSKALSDFAVTASKSPRQADPLSENEWRDQLKSLLKRISIVQESALNIREYETLEILSSKLLSLSESQDVYALPNLHRYTSNRRMPFILAVFDMYGSIDRADEVMRRNRLDYPVYIEMGTVLEYLK